MRMVGLRFGHTRCHNHHRSGVVHDFNRRKSLRFVLAAFAWNRTAVASFAFVAKSNRMWCWLDGDQDVRIRLRIETWFVSCHFVYVGSTGRGNFYLRNEFLFIWNTGVLTTLYQVSGFVLPNWAVLCTSSLSISLFYFWTAASNKRYLTRLWRFNTVQSTLNSFEYLLVKETRRLKLIFTTHTHKRVLIQIPHNLYRI